MGRPPRLRLTFTVGVQLTSRRERHSEAADTLTRPELTPPAEAHRPEERQRQQAEQRRSGAIHRAPVHGITLEPEPAPGLCRILVG